GLERVGATDVQAVPAGAKSSVAWQVKILKPGKFSLGVASSTGITQRKSLIIEPPDEKTGPFTFDLVGEIRPGQTFEVIAKIADPAPGQTLTLTLPNELKLKEGEATQAVPAAAGSTVTWRVQVV